MTVISHLGPKIEQITTQYSVRNQPTGHDKKSRTKIKIQLTQLVKGINMLSFFRGIVGQKFKQKRLEKGKLLLSEVVRESYFGLVFRWWHFFQWKCFLFLERTYYFLLDADTSGTCTGLPYKRRELEENACFEGRETHVSSGRNNFTADLYFPKA